MKMMLLVSMTVDTPSRVEMFLLLSFCTANISIAGRLSGAANLAIDLSAFCMFIIQRPRLAAALQPKPRTQHNTLLGALAPNCGQAANIFLLIEYSTN